jgi:transmembrane sensor
MKFDSDSRADTPLRDQADAWWWRLRSGAVTRDEAEAFRRWRGQSADHMHAWSEVVRVWQSLEPVGAAAVQRDPSIMHAPAPAQPHPGRSGRRAFFGAAVAASVAGVLVVRPPLGLWPSITEYTADYRTGTGEQRQVALADQMTMQMNTQTRVNRRDGGAAATAIELVAGEAEIDTSAATRSLTVYAGEGRVTARAARFNVRYTGPQVCVTCLAGSVGIDHPAGRETIKAGNQVVYGTHVMQAPVPADPVATAWLTGSLVFVDTPLTDVVAEINRYRTGQVILRNAELARRRVRMRFAADQTDDALAMIGQLYGAKVTRLPAGIVLLS